MQLKKCIHCGKDIAAGSVTCPSCGAPIETARGDAMEAPSEGRVMRSKWHHIVPLSMIITGAFLTAGSASTVGPDHPTVIFGLLLTVAGLLVYASNEFRARKHRR